jgi:hypothetical protein
MGNKPSFLAKQEDDLKKLEIEVDAEGKPVKIEGEGETPAEEGAEPETPEGGEEGGEGKEQPVSDTEKRINDLIALNKQLADENLKLQTSFEGQEKTIGTLQDIVKHIGVKPKEEEEPAQEAVVNKIDVNGLDDYDPKIKEIIEAHNALVDLNAELRTKMGTLEQTGASVAGKVTEVKTEVDHAKGESFWNKVRGQVEEFDDINGNDKGLNADPRWGEYLEGVEPISGMKRREIAKKAINGRDDKHLVVLLNDFKQSVNYQKPAAGEKKKGIKSQIVPGVGTGNAGGETKVKKITKDQYEKAADARAHRKMSDAEFEKIAKGYELTLQQQA